MLSLLFLIFYYVNGINSSKVEYSKTKLNVHIVPHTHDDPGWLKTADQYYYGSNTSIYRAGVQYILDTVTEELEKDRNKNFVYVEMSFFQRWYFEQTESKKARVKELIKSGQLSFANGGWVMHDEAGSHFVSMIDQTTLGHRFLLDEFNYLPRVGWQIDPFGHSASQPSLFGSDLGFDSLFFGRIDYEDRQIRKENQNLEFVWRALKSNPNSELLTGVFSDGNYGYPNGFCFDVCCEDNPVMDDPRLEDYNVDQMVSKFVDAILQEQSYSKGNHIMLKMGSDFHYAAANMWYKNLDKIIKHVNENDDRFHLFYSNPTKYTDARAEEGLTWSVKLDDFFPYADCEHCYWGGYFTSRPTLKYIERLASSFLQVLKQFSSFEKSHSKESIQTLFDFTAAIGLVNHHDAITGTSKQHVADDYTKILDKAFTAAEKLVSEKISSAVFVSGSNLKLDVCRSSYNESTCSISQSIKDGTDIAVVVYNALPRKNTQQVTVFLPEIPSNSYVSVMEVSSTGEMNDIPLEVFPTAKKNGLTVAPFTLVFTANVPALFLSRFIVKFHVAAAAAAASNTKINVLKKVNSYQADPVVIKNDKVSVTFDANTGMMTQISRVDIPVSASVTNDFFYYKSYGSPGIKGYKYPEKDDRDPHIKNLKPSKSSASSSTSTQASGAYIFRPADGSQSGVTQIRDSQSPVITSVMESNMISEVRQQFSSWASQVVRIREGSEVVELEWTVGPIPIDDNIGKEVISRFDSDLDSELKVYTDANGREFQERLKNYRPTWDLRGGNGESEPEGGNYYPITAAAYIKDEARGHLLTVLTDRSEGTASLETGQLEFMVHRRLTADDNRGVNEALNETTGGMTPYPTWKRMGDGITVSGKHYLILSDITNGLKETRAMMDKIYQPLKTFYSPVSSDLKAYGELSFSPTLSTELPVNCALLTLETWAPNTLLLRLAHQFAVEEDPNLSIPIVVDIAELLKAYSPISMKEMSLSVNQDKLTMLQNKIKWPSSSTLKQSIPFENVGFSCGEPCLKTQLSPMDVKTFLISIA